MTARALGETRVSAFAPGELATAALLAGGVEIGLFVLFIAAGASRGDISEKQATEPEPIPISVRPVLDETPLLKLGGKKLKAKLPEMWKKQPPVQRFEEKSAPSPLAKKTPDAIPTSKLAELDATAPPPDAEVAKEVDQELLDAGPDAESTEEGEGTADGVKEGTEADPLKARAVSQYEAKIRAWFSARFRPPTEDVPCEELKGLSASVAANVGGSREVSGFSVVRPSGNAAFDARVQSTMQSIVGQELPPPPPLYPDILGSVVRPVFSGRAVTCD